jgi:SsrA-binding protein
VNLKGAFGVLRNGEVWLEGMNISPYESSGYVTHEPERSRKLLLHRREIRRLIGAVEQKGLTLVPLDMHFAKGYAKITLALARGKRAPDKREDLKKRSAEREMARSVGRQR